MYKWGSENWSYNHLWHLEWDFMKKIEFGRNIDHCIANRSCSPLCAEGILGKSDITLFIVASVIPTNIDMPPHAIATHVGVRYCFAQLCNVASWVMTTFSIFQSIVTTIKIAFYHHSSVVWLYTARTVSYCYGNSSAAYVTISSLSITVLCQCQTQTTIAILVLE